MSSTDLRQAIKESGATLSYERAFGAAVDAIFTKMPDHILKDSRVAGWLATVLPSLSTSHRELLVVLATSGPDVRDGSSAQLLKVLGARMACLSETQRGRLVSAAIRIDNEPGRATALQGFGAGMACLSEAQCRRLITAAFGIRDVGCRVRALAGLGAGSAHMSEAQRKRLPAAVRSRPAPSAP
jgi:hypothetical protein